MEWIIKTNKIMVRPVQLEDASILVKWWNDGNLMKHVGFSKGLNTNIDKVKMQISKQNDNKIKMFIIYDAINKQPIGELSFGELDLTNKSCRIGIKICEVNLQGKGYGHHSLCEFIKYLFSYYNLEKIFIDTFLSNNRAVNLYKKIGSEVIEIKKSFWTNPEGISYDVIFFQLAKNKFFNYYT